MSPFSVISAVTSLLAAIPAALWLLLFHRANTMQSDPDGIMRILFFVLPLIVTIGLVGTLIGIIGLILNRRCLLNWLAVAVNAGLLVVPAKEWWEFRTAALHQGYGCDPFRGRLINLCDQRCRSFPAQPACHVVRRIKMGRNELFELRGAVGFQSR
jgi:hypothetical protein